MKNQFKIIPMSKKVAGDCKIDCDTGCVISMTAKPDSYSITRASAVVGDITGGMVYDIKIPYRAALVSGCKVQVIASWVMENGDTYSRGYLVIASDDLMTLRYHTHESVVSLELEYRFCSHGGGSVIFYMPQISCIGEYQPRYVRFATAWIKPQDNNTAADNVIEMHRIIDNAGTSGEKPDMIVFTETVYGCNVYSLTTEERALKIDSPEVTDICAKAAKYRMYIIVGLYINDAGLIKNVALVINRNGEIQHIYQKTHLPMYEAGEGVVPGSEIPVFDLDFGTIGILICWDQFFSETSRILHKKGAEIIVIPTAGDTEIQSRARALDSGAYVIVSGTHQSSSSMIIDPHGDIIATISDIEKGYTDVEVDLNKRFCTYWISVGPCYGEERDVFLNERRSDLYKDLTDNIS